MVLSKRCRLREDDREKLMEAAKVPGVSVRTMHKLWNIFHDQKKRKISWSTCQRTLQREKAPLRQCFDTLTLPGRPGRRDAVLLVANLPNLLRHMLDRALQLADLWGENTLLQPVLYHDEAQAGNILSLQKLKKCSLFYLTFDIFLPLFGDTAAWLPVAVLPKEELNQIEGIGCAIAAAVKHWQNFHGSRVTGLKQTIHLAAHWKVLLDGDALRGTFDLKGAGGIRPCMLCSNVLKAHSRVDDDLFCEISEWRKEKFLPLTDREIFAQADALKVIEGKKAIQAFEKSCGLRKTLRGVLMDPVARELLPPSQAAVDCMHLYFVNGCANFELALLWQAINAALPQMTHHALKLCCLEAMWQRPWSSGHKGPSLFGELWSEHAWHAEQFKGEAWATSIVVPLLNYYLDKFVRPRGVCPDATRSFECLALRFRWAPIADWQEVKELDAWSHVRQQCFVRCYSAEACRPKHHWRLHLAEWAMMLKFMPYCERHESKHRTFKSGGCGDREAHHVHNPSVYASNVLSSLLLMQFDGSDLTPWKLHTPVVSAPDLRGSQQSDGVRIWSTNVRKGDILLLDVGARAGMMTGAVCRDAAPFIEYVNLRLTSRETYGAIFERERTCKRTLRQIDLSGSLQMPVWWSWAGDKVTCLF